MPRAALVLLASALLASGCTSACKELGNRLCRCRAEGVTRSSCEQSVKSEISSVNPSKNVQAVCSEKLDTCSEPDGVDFCDWIEGRCGKASCGLSAEDDCDKAICETPPAVCSQ
jgi:hypothetical protein